MNKIILSGMSLEQITELTDSLNESKYRAKQIHNWIYQKSVSSFDEMTDISKTFREKLKSNAIITDIKIIAIIISTIHPNLFPDFITFSSSFIVIVIIFYILILT